MNYTEMLFNRDERLVNLLNQADIKNLELIEEINNREEEIERLNNIIKEVRNTTIKMIANSGLDFMYRQAYKDILEILDKGDYND